MYAIAKSKQIINNFGGITSMKIINVSDVETNRKELEIQIEKAEFDAAVTEAFKKNAGKINVPGFRKGHAPRSVIEKMYGKGVFYEDALNDIVPKTYSDAVKESGLEVVSAPEYDVKTIDENGVVLMAKVYVKPECKVEDYMGIKVEKEPIVVTDDAVEHEIQSVRERSAREIDVTDRPAQNGDKVVFDFEGFCVGKEFDGGKAEKYSLKLGSGQFIPGFEDQICGHNPGDEFDVNVTFPTEYQEASLAGKPAVFKCKLHEIKFDELPEVDDEFAKDNGFDTLDEYKADIKAKLENSAKKADETRVEEKLLDTLVEKLNADIPEAMYENETENCVRDYENRLRYQGMDLDMFMKYTGMTIEKLREQMRPQAERNVKVRLALETIAKQEKLEAAKEKIEEEYKKIADAYNIEIEKVKEAIAEADIKADVVVAQALEFIKSHADIKIKKATAKKTTKKAAKAETEEAVSEEKTDDAATEEKPVKKTRKTTKKAEETADEGKAE